MKEINKQSHGLDNESAIVSKVFLAGKGDLWSLTTVKTNRKKKEYYSLACESAFISKVLLTEQSYLGNGHKWRRVSKTIKTTTFVTITH